MSDQIVSIDCSKELRSEGSQVAGSVNFNTRLAKEKDITAVKVSLKARMNTWIQVSAGQSTYRVEENEQIFKTEHILWSNGSTLPDHLYEIINYPFSFTIPDSAEFEKPLPPSLSCGNWAHGCRIQYYVHCIAEKQAWYKRNTRVNSPFPFLPLDRTSDPDLNLDSWTGSWTKTEKTINVRHNTLKIFGGQGAVEVSVYLPEIDSYPLFVRIPCRIHIICCSKPMSSSHAFDPSSFIFPRNPKMTDISLKLTQRYKIAAKHYHRRFTESYGLLGGFGTLENLANIETEMSDPVWVPDEGKGDKGKWKESVTYSAHLIFRCPTSVDTRLIRSETNIEAKIDFPGLGNSWKTSIGPLPISSGVNTPQQIAGSQGSSAFDIEVPPTYWEIMGEDGGDSKEEKKEKS